MEQPRFTVSQFVDVFNQTLEYSFPSVELVGEVASFKINQGKWVFFELKDENCSVSCFMPAWELRAPLEDGMKVILRGSPRLTKIGKFSVTVRQIMPLGEGNIKKSFEILKAKLAKEGLFDLSKKRPIPTPLERIAVISSTQAAGYADFIKILGERWGGLKIEVAHVQVQGLAAADQIIRALDYFNETGSPDVIAIIRGGGSQDDLAVFNDEKLVRAIAASRIPVITGIGHEVDESLADLAADIRASTPSNAAQMLTKDRCAEREAIRGKIEHLSAHLSSEIEHAKLAQREQLLNLKDHIVVKITTSLDAVKSQAKILAALSPEKVLKQGYAILSGKISPGESISITTKDQLINAEITNVQPRN